MCFFVYNNVYNMQQWWGNVSSYNIRISILYIFTRSASECLSNLSLGDRENLGFREYRFRQNNDKYVCDYVSREASDEEHRTRTYRIFMQFLNAFNADSIDLKNNRRKDGGRSHSPCLANREHLLAIIRLFLSKHHRKMSVQKNTWLRDKNFALEYIFNCTRFLPSISKLLRFILKRRVNVSNQWNCKTRVKEFSTKYSSDTNEII